MSKDFVVTIYEDAPRARIFTQVFGRRDVCVTSPIPAPVKLAGFDKPQSCYMLDLDELTADERQRLIDFAAATFNVDCAEIEAQLNTTGLPILARDCTLTIYNPHKWID